MVHTHQLLDAVRRCLADAGFDLDGPSDGGLHLTLDDTRVLITWSPRDILLTLARTPDRQVDLPGIRDALHAAAGVVLAEAGFILEPGTQTVVLGRN